MTDSNQTPTERLITSIQTSTDVLSEDARKILIDLVGMTDKLKIPVVLIFGNNTNGSIGEHVAYSVHDMQSSNGSTHLRSENELGIAFESGCAECFDGWAAWIHNDEHFLRPTSDSHIIRYSEEEGLVDTHEVFGDFVSQSERVRAAAPAPDGAMG